MLSETMHKNLWAFVWTVFVRPFPKTSGQLWEIFLLKRFGATVGKNCAIYSSARILMPRNLVIEDRVCLAHHVIIHNTAPITLKYRCRVSQYSYLCAGTHDIRKKNFDTIRKPIIIENHAWVAAKCFIGPGVTIGEGAVCGAASVVFKDIEPWTVVCGNPAKFVKKRVIIDL